MRNSTKRMLDRTSRSYKEALLYLLLSQTSCFRYWGQGVWTDYAKELCRRGMEAIEKGKTFVPLQAQAAASKPQATAPPKVPLPDSHSYSKKNFLKYPGGDPGN